ncbi:hypothetical protein NCC49_002839 [Naganishia albida]|nr:hypothetical protein NCC49_002839 [Naganishia albida]
MNIGTGPVKIASGTLLGTPLPLRTPSKEQKAKLVNHVKSDSNVPIPEKEQLLEAIKEMDINPELNIDERRKMEELIVRQHRAFAYGSRKLGQTDMATMTIDTGDAKPISQAPYHASPAGRRLIDETIHELIAEDVIEESDSPWASPTILVQQKGKDRFCIDYRKINEVTKSDQYPIPRIDDILSQFSGVMYFTTFDANKGFHQIEIDP